MIQIHFCSQAKCVFCLFVLFFKKGFNRIFDNLECVVLSLHLSDSYACSYSQEQYHKHTFTVSSFIVLKTTVLKSYFESRFYEYGSCVHIYESVK